MTHLLNQLNNEMYAQPLDIFKGSSIGQHFRHILDFYLCLIKGIQEGMVDYARRDRNPLVESDVNFTKSVFEEVAQTIEAFSEEQPLQVLGDFSDKEVTRPYLLSSIGRELMYAYDHAVHHLAMIKIGIAVAAPDLVIDQNIGVAPSTIKHRSAVQTVGS
ncbi:MAG: hypothetical protein ACK4TA_05070 [Saprospiraceae bacterium]